MNDDDDTKYIEELKDYLAKPECSLEERMELIKVFREIQSVDRHLLLQKIEEEATNNELKLLKRILISLFLMLIILPVFGFIILPLI